jgi:hypothetical protein
MFEEREGRLVGLWLGCIAVMQSATRRGGMWFAFVLALASCVSTRGGRVREVQIGLYEFNVSRLYSWSLHQDLTVHVKTREFSPRMPTATSQMVKQRAVGGCRTVMT